MADEYIRQNILYTDRNKIVKFGVKTIETEICVWEKTHFGNMASKDTRYKIP